MNNANNYDDEDEVDDEEDGEQRAKTAMINVFIPWFAFKDNHMLYTPSYCTLLPQVRYLTQVR